MSKEEACRIASKLARAHGGRPADYMQEAWEIVRFSKKPKSSRTSKRLKLDEETTKGGKSLSLIGTGAKVAGSWAARKTAEKIAKKRMEKRYQRHANRSGGYYREKSKFSETKDSLNFMKSPKDKPSDVFGGLFNSMTKSPQKVEVPHSVKKYVKDTFRFF